MTISTRAKVAAGLVLAMGVLGVATMPLLSVSGSLPLGLAEAVRGFVVGQTVIVAAMLALGSMPRIRRVALGMAFALLLILPSVVLSQVALMFDASAGLAAVMLFGLVFGIGRMGHFAGWRLTSPRAEGTEENEENSAKKVPLAAGEIVLWVVGVLALLVCSVLVLWGSDVFSLLLGIGTSVAIAFWQTLLALPVFLCLFGMLYQGSWGLVKNLALAFVLIVLMTAVIFAVALDSVPNEVIFALLFEVGACLAALLLTGILALGGWRLKGAGPNLFTTQAAFATAAAPGSEPAADVPELPTRPGGFKPYLESFRRHRALWLVLIGYWVFSVLVGLVGAVWFDTDSAFAWLAMGGLLAQPVLLSIWITLYRAPLSARLPAAAAAMLVSCMALAVGHALSPYGDMPFELVLILLMAAMWLVGLLCIPGLVWRATSRRLMVGPAPPWRALSGAGQFSLADLMLWTAGAAVLLGVSRAVFHDFMSSDFLEFLWGSLWAVPSTLIAMFILFLIILPEYFLSRAVLNPLRWRLWLLIWIGLEVIYCGIIGLFFLDGPYDYFFDFLGYYLSLKLGMAFCIVGTLAILARCGYRSLPLRPPTIEKIPPTIAPPPGWSDTTAADSEEASALPLAQADLPAQAEPDQGTSEDNSTDTSAPAHDSTDPPEPTV